MVLHFFPHMNESRHRYGWSWKLKFKIQLLAFHFQIVKILSCVFSPGLALTSEGKSFIICSVTGKPSLLKACSALHLILATHEVQKPMTTSIV